MSRGLFYLPEVARDYTDAFGYYEALSSATALKFDAAFSRAEADVESGLVTHHRIFGEYHRVYIGRFPYHLYDRLKDANAVVVGVLYARFSPQRLEETLRAREA